jgi:hypothetical protein
VAGGDDKESYELLESYKLLAISYELYADMNGS